MEQVDNDKEFLIDICGDLKEEVASHLAKIETALQGTLSADELKGIKGSAHAIKGSSANLMCVEMSEKAKELENAVINIMNGGDVSCLQPAFMSLREAYLRWCQYLN